MKQKIFSRVFSIVIATMLLVSLCTIAVSANNHTDTAFQFTFSGSSPVYTSSRNKLDDSNCYMLAHSSDSTFIAWATGYGYNGVHTDFSGGYIYNIYAGNEVFMRNWVYENGKVSGSGYKQLSIAARNNGGGINAYGLWSPDSV